GGRDLEMQHCNKPPIASPAPAALLRGLSNAPPVPLFPGPGRAALQSCQPVLASYSSIRMLPFCSFLEAAEKKMNWRAFHHELPGRPRPKTGNGKMRSLPCRGERGGPAGSLLY